MCWYSNCTLKINDNWNDGVNFKKGWAEIMNEGKQQEIGNFLDSF
jgi:hypothetical protein